MKKLTFLTRLTLIAGLFLATASAAFATVTVTPATGGTAISADSAGTGGSGAWTTLGAITIAEGFIGDFAVGTNITLILKTPAGFELNTGVTPDISVTAGTNITSAAVAVTDTNTITITLTVAGITIMDTLAIGSTTGIQVRPTVGTPLATGKHIYRPTTGGGTATITGITTSTDGSAGSNFGNLTEVGGAVTKLAFTTQPVGGTYGSALGTQPVVKSQDQFNNNSTNGLGSSLVVSLALTAGTGSLVGTTNLDIGTANGKGTATYSGLKTDAAGSGDVITATAGSLTSATSNPFNVAQKALTVTATAANKVYDGTTAATVTLSDNRISGDVLTVNYTNSTFSSSAVGTRTATVSGITLSGPAGGNYTVNSTATDNASITAKPLTVSGVTASNKVYNGTKTATVSTNGATLVGVVSGDTVNLGGTAAGLFASATVGTGKTVTFSGLTISGTSSGNYTLTQPTASADITIATLTVTATGVNRVYDATTNATVTLADNRASGDSVTLTYTAGFVDKNVGTAKPVSVNGIAITGGAEAVNYTLGNTTASATANITAKALTVTVTGSNKVYDGTTAATVTLTDNRIAGDSLTVNYTNSTFSSSAVGTRTATVSGINLTGPDAANYTPNTSATDNASITAKGLTVAGVTASNKVYDRTTTATVSTNGASLVGVVSGDTVNLSGTAAGTFADKNVGTGKTVTVSGLTLGGTSAANYTVTQPTTTADITVATLTVTATGVNRVYDGTTNTTVTLTDNHIGADAVTTSFASAGFADKNVGTAKPVSVSGIAITGGAAAGNYTLGNTTASTTANITAKALTVTVTGTNKVYDGTTAAAVTLTDNRLAGDSLTVNYTNSTFATAAVGNSKTVTVSGITLSGTDGGNYTTSATATDTSVNITAKPLTVSGVTASNKVYNGNTTATVSTNGATLVGVVSGDTVNLSGTAAGVFADKNVGTGKTVTVSGLTITGTSAANYTVTQPIATADITPATLTVAATATSRIYDGTTNATATLSDNHIGSDSVTTSFATAGFADKNVGTAKPVNVNGIAITGGAAAGNYTLGNTTASTTANITVKTLTVTVTAANKAYDGTNTAAVTFSDNRIAGDVLTESDTSATFSSSTVGNSKTVTVTGIAISGADAGNYTLSSTSATDSANITKAALTVSGVTASNKVYNGNTNATVSTNGAALVGIVGAEIVNLGGTATGAFADKNVATGKAVTVSGLTISGANAGNYSLTQPTITADITAKALTVSGVTASNKVYNGNTTATVSTNGAALVGVISGDTVGLSGTAAGAFADQNAGTGKTVTVSGLTLGGTSAANYTMTQPTATANITVATLTVGATATGRAYNATTNVTVTLFDNHFGSDDVTTTFAAAWFANKNVGTGKTVSVSGIAVTGGAAAGNYTLGNTTASTTADITVQSLTVSGITADNKPFDGTTVATIHAGSAILIGKFSGDDVTPNTAGATGTFADATIGTGKTVYITGLTLDGTDAGNYSPTEPTSTADITSSVLTVTGIEASNKVYDGTTNAMLNVINAALVGVVSGDGVSLDATNATAAFVDKAAGTHKTVIITGLGLFGADAGKYKLMQPTANADITPASLTASVTVSDKIYDGTTAATITGRAFDINNPTVSIWPDTAVPGTLDSGPDDPVELGVRFYSDVSGVITGIRFYKSNANTGTHVGSLRAMDGTLLASVTFTNESASGWQQMLFATPVSIAANTFYVASFHAEAGHYSADSGYFSTNGVDSPPLHVPANAVFGGNGVFAYNTNSVFPNQCFNAINYWVDVVLVTNTATPGYVVYDSDDVSLVGGTASFADKNAGTNKTVTVTGLSLSGADAGNYSLVSDATTTPADISPAPLTITADTLSRGYGVTNPVFTAGYNGFVNGDDSGVLTGTLSFSCLDTNAVAVDTNSPVGTYPIVVNGLSAANYTLAYVAGALTVTQAVLTINADSFNRPYGATNPVLTAGYTGFVNGENTNALSGSPDLSTDADIHSAAGTYSIAVSLGTLSTNGNYTFNLTNGTLTVTAYALTINVDSQTRLYGQINSPLSGTVTGLQNGDILPASYSTAADTNSDVGVYPIAVSLTDPNSKLSNYTVTTNGGSVTVNPAALTVKARDDHDTYDGTAYIGGNGVIYTGLVNGQNASVLGGTLTYTGSSQGAINAGTYIIIPGGLTSGNYTINFQNGTLTIFPATPTLTWGNPTDIVYGTALGGGQLNATAGVAGSFDYNPAGGTVLNAGNSQSLSVTFTPADTLNYYPANAAAQINVIKAPLTITADNKSKTQGLPNPALTAGYSGFVNGDNTNALTIPATLSTTADAASPVASYPITASGAVAANYTINYVGGTLTVVAQPEVGSVSASGNQFTLSWPTIVGQRYQVEYKDSLDDPAWTPLGTPAAGTGNPLTLNDDMNNSLHRFYRLKITQP